MVVGKNSLQSFNENWKLFRFYRRPETLFPVSLSIARRSVARKRVEETRWEMLLFEQTESLTNVIKKNRERPILLPYVNTRRMQYPAASRKHHGFVSFTLRELLKSVWREFRGTCGRYCFAKKKEERKKKQWRDSEIRDASFVEYVAATVSLKWEKEWRNSLILSYLRIELYPILL